MYQIRGYEPKDYHGVEKVCIEAADAKLMVNEAFKMALLDVFCRYYIEKEPENCFVAVDDNDMVCGYILCAKDYAVYREIFCKEYLTSENPVTKMMGEPSMEVMKDYAESYPAHLHIDLLPECQGKGTGRQLIETLAAHLRAQGVKGLMLDVAADNSGARAFYEKCGFEALKSTDKGILMGVTL